jgi:type II secretory pathway pseudopilin PulG
VTAKTNRDTGDADDVAETAEVAAEEESPAASSTEASEASGSGRRKRRVRVIEVIEDDEELDDVLARIDAEDGEPEPVAKPAPKAVPKPAKDEDEPEAPAPARPVLLGLPLPQAVALIVVVAVLASLALWQWRSASGKASEAEERAAVAKVARQYGDVAANYNASNYREQIAAAEKLMGGDLLDRYKNQTAPGIINTFKAGETTASLTSRSVAVFVGDVNDKFATAVVQVDIEGRTPQGATQAPANLIRLALAKIDGGWKVTKQYASGENDQTQAQNQNGSTLPTASPSTSPTKKN